MATPMDLDTAYSLLSAEQRRQLLSLFRDARVWTVSDIAAEIAAREAERPPETVDDELVRRIRVSLVHNHLPRLADHGVLEWDGRSGDVVRAERFTAIEPFLTATDEEESAVASPSVERR